MKFDFFRRAAGAALAVTLLSMPARAGETPNLINDPGFTGQVYWMASPGWQACSSSSGGNPCEGGTGTISFGFTAGASVTQSMIPLTPGPWTALSLSFAAQAGTFNDASQVTLEIDDMSGSPLDSISWSGNPPATLTVTTITYTNTTILSSAFFAKVTITDTAGNGWAGNYGPQFSGLNLVYSYPTTIFAPVGGVAVDSRTPVMAWAAQTPGGLSELQLATDLNFVGVIADSITANSFYISTNTLTNGATYWWRVGVAGTPSWSSTGTFTVDSVAPALTSAQASTATVWIGLPTATTFSSSTVSVRTLVQDPNSGLLVLNASPSSLVAQWRFDESSGTASLDSSGNGYNGTVMPTGRARVPGIHGLAMPFDGTSNFVSVPAFSPTTFSEGISIEAWVYPTGINQPAIGANSGACIIDADEDNGTDGFDLGIRNDGKIWWFPAGGQDLYSSGTVPLNTWTHLALTFDGSFTSMYINGVLDSQQLGVPPQVATFVKIGGRGYVTGYFKGSIDDVRVFSTPLSPLQIAADYQTDALAAQFAGVPYSVAYTTTAGAAWSFVSTSAVAMSGSNATTSVQTLQADNIPFAVSAVPGVNQVAFFASDLAGNVATTSYSILVALPGPAGPSNPPPGNLSLLWVSSTTAGLSWNSGGNSSGTVYALQSSPDGVSWAGLLTTTFTAAIDAGLSPNTSYYFRVLASASVSSTVVAYTSSFDELFGNNENASVVLGQSGFTTAAAAASQKGLSGPSSVVLDAAGRRAFVADNGNNRVLVYDLSGGAVNGMNAAYVIGQTGFSGSGSGNSASAMNMPEDLAFDAAGQRLFVADTGNNRILVFNLAAVPAGPSGGGSAGLANGMSASSVIGQAAFGTGSPGTSQTALSVPFALTYDAKNGRLFAADWGNNRVMVFDVSSGTTNGMPAIAVLGQPSFTANAAATSQSGLSGPIALAYDFSSGVLYVGDGFNNRVLSFNLSGGIANGMNAGGVLGQADFVSHPAATTAGGMEAPVGLAVDVPGHRVFVSNDGGVVRNRVQVFDVSGGLVNGMAAKAAVGQPDFVSASSGTSQNQLFTSLGVSFDAGARRLAVADYSNNRVLLFGQTGIPASVSPAIVSASSSSVQARWGLVSGATSYTLVASTSSAFPPVTISAQNGNTTVPGSVSGLAPSTSYYLFVSATGAGGPSPYIPLGLAVTAANFTTSLQGATTTTLQVGWSATGFAAGAVFTAQLSTASDFSVVSASAPSSTGQAVFSGLASNTSYYIRVVQPTGGNGVVMSTATRAAPPAGSSASTPTGASVLLQWGLNGNAPDTQFAAFLSTYSDMTSVSSSMIVSTTSALFSSVAAYTTFYLHVQALGRDGSPTAFDVIVATMTGTPPPPLPPVPSISAMALSSGTIVWKWTVGSGQVTNFELWSSTGGLIVQLPASATYYTEGGLTVNTLYSGYLEASNAAGNVFSSTVSAATPNSIQVGAQGGVITDPVTGQTGLSVPANVSTMSLSFLLTSNPFLQPLLSNTIALISSGTYALPASLHGSTTSVREYLATAGESRFQGLMQNAVTVTVPYPDANNTGFVDGTTPPLPAANLVLYTINEATALWEPVPGSTVDLVHHTVSAQVPHLSIFSAFGAAAAADLQGARAYPVPFKPNGKNPDQGKPYSPGDTTSGIIFDRLTDQVTIKIYDMAGRLVARVDSSATGGSLRWDARNDAGRDVSTGAYLAVISSPGSKTIVKKLLIVR
jgi:sugar lactone lactonase YvrE